MYDEINNILSFSSNENNYEWCSQNIKKNTHLINFSKDYSRIIILLRLMTTTKLAI